MDGNADCTESQTNKVSMWIDNDYAVFELYGRGNYNARKDVEDYMKEYSSKFTWPEGKSRVLDIGSGDGSVTTVLSKHLPSNCEVTGSDINKKVVEYANRKYGNERVKFIPFDVLGEVPNAMKGQFDHVFASYLFHWVQDYEKAFTNIYNILPKGGEFFSISLARCNVYSVFRILSKREKWAPWMKQIDKFISKYHDTRDPEIDVANTLKKVGFKMLDSRCKQKFYVNDMDIFRGLMTGINCFDVPKHMWSDFLDDMIEVYRYNGWVDDENRTVRMVYNLVLFHCVKE